MVRRRADSSAWHSSFYRHAWIAIAKVGLPGIYLQDLRHAGNTLNDRGWAWLEVVLELSLLAPFLAPRSI